MSLTPLSFNQLLAVLGPDRERAGERYLRIRKKLVKFFEWHGCRCPDDLADRTIDRVCRKVEEGEAIRAAEPSAYFHGVARNILKEHWTENRREVALLRSVNPTTDFSDGLWQEGAVTADSEQRLRCLEQCLQSLPPESQDLILCYYEGPTSQRIETRKALADRLGIHPNALRIRSYRLRARLEACVLRCLKRA